MPRESRRQPNAQAEKRQRRASRRRAISLNLANRSLRDLMIEQCRDGADYITVYRGSREELAAAGIPHSILDLPAAADFRVQTENACCTGAHELLRGSIRAEAGAYEMEIYWGAVRPYVQAAHPAICELARMMLKDILAWTDDEGSLIAPLTELAADPRAVDYKPGLRSPCLQVTPQFLRQLEGMARYVYEMVHSTCEVLPQAEAAEVPARNRPGALRLVVDNS